MSVERWGQMAGQLAVSVFAILLMAEPGLAGDSSDEAWAALAKGGHVALIRHGNAPPGYGGDPPGFRFDDCQTQRNLDDVGREQARVLGEAFRKHGVRVDRIVSSPMCRCIETGQLMAVGAVETSSSLLPDTGTGRRVGGDGVLVARTGNAGACDSRADRWALDRVHLGTGRNARASTDP